MPPMRAVDRLPPLSALRVFEAASRHPNFSAAAVELHLTPGAVSRQVTTLERELGVALFVREARRTRLTHAGAQLAERVRDAFATLRDAVRGVAQEEARRIVVTALPSFASRWLIPRLPGFSRRHPRIEIDLRPSREVVALDRGGIDLAIRYGRGKWPGTDSLRLMEEVLFPVCSPDLPGKSRIRTPADLLELPLIHDSDFPWSLLFEAVGVQFPRRLAGIRMDDSNLAQQAAERGQGVLLGRSVLVADALADGRLVRLRRAGSVGSDYAYFVAWSRRRELPAPASTFRDWLLEEARARPQTQRRAAPRAARRTPR